MTSPTVPSGRQRSTGTILVTGATGTVGREVVRCLLERGARVRSFVRDPARAARLLGPDVELAIGDYTQPRTIDTALDGVAGVFLLTPADPSQAEWEGAIAAASARAGVRRIVKLSAHNADLDSPVADLRWHRQGERHVERSGIAYTLLRCNFFMQFFLGFARSIAADGAFAAPVGNGRVGAVDARDIGAVAAAVLTEEGHDGRTYELTGSEALSYADVAALLGEATGRAVRFVETTTEAAGARMSSLGLPDWQVEIMLRLYDGIRAGEFALVSTAVRDVTGAQPITFRRFAGDYAESFRSGEGTTAIG